MAAGMILVETPPLGMTLAGKRHFCSARCAEAWFSMSVPAASRTEPALVVERPAAVPRAPRSLAEVLEDAGVGVAPAGTREAWLADEDAALDVPPLYPDGDAPGRVVSAREFVPRRSSVSE